MPEVNVAVPLESPIREPSNDKGEDSSGPETPHDLASQHSSKFRILEPEVLLYCDRIGLCAGVALNLTRPQKPPRLRHSRRLPRPT